MQTAPGELSRRIGQLETAVRDLAERPIAAVPSEADAKTDTKTENPPTDGENAEKERKKTAETANVPEVPTAEVPKLSPELLDRLHTEAINALGDMKAAFWIDSEFFFDGMTLFVMESPFCEDLITPKDTVLLREAVQAALGDGVAVKPCKEPPKAEADKSGFDAVMGAWDNAPNLPDNSAASEASEASRASAFPESSEPSHQSEPPEPPFESEPSYDESMPPFDMEPPYDESVPPFDMEPPDEPEPPEPPEYQ